MSESNGKTPREILFRGKVKYNMPPQQKADDWAYGNYNKYDETSIVDSTGFAFYVCDCAWKVKWYGAIKAVLFESGEYAAVIMPMEAMREKGN